MIMAVVAAADADMVSTPVAAIDQSSPPVKARVVAALVLPMAITSALAAPLVAMFTVVVPSTVTPPMSTVPVMVPSARFRVVAAPPMDKVVTVALNTFAVVVVEVMSAAVAPFTAKSPVIVVSSESAILLDPESMVILPVVDPPRVRLCMAVVERVPVAVR